MALQGWNETVFERKYSRGVYRAIRRAAKEIGREVLDEYQEDGLEGTKKKRRTRAKFKVHKNNTLAWVDYGFDARVREYGATIRGKGGKQLLVVTDPKYREKLRRDTAKGRDHNTFFVKGRTGLVLMHGHGDKAKPVAVLKRRVVRKPINRNDRLSAISERNIDKYMRRIEQIIVEAGA